MAKYTVVGSGIIGLYTAYKLIQKLIDPEDITIISEFLPGDESIQYTSPYAGADFSCITGDDTKTLVYDKIGYLNLRDLQSKLGGPRCGIDQYYSNEYFTERPSDRKIKSLKAYLENFEEIPKSEFPKDKGIEYGLRFKTWNFNAPKVLVSLYNYLTRLGIRTQRKKLLHISEAFSDDTVVVFNCTGLGAKTLGGINDTNVYPTRGQVLVVKAPHITENRHLWGKDFATYIIRRPYSNDQVILGGFMQKDNWTGSTFLSESEDILKRIIDLYPEFLTQNPSGKNIENVEVIRAAAGLRPSRKGSVRIERQKYGDGRVIIHNYGASGYGYQAGLGMAEEATGLAFKSDPKL